jgi:hypothetical protein
VPNGRKRRRRTRRTGVRMRGKQRELGRESERTAMEKREREAEWGVSVRR